MFSRLAVLACAVSAVAAAPASAEVPAGVLDLRTDYDARIDGDPFRLAGYVVASVGDVNGDGRGDLAVRAFGSGSTFSGDHVFVLFGRPDWDDIDLASVGPADGFRIEGAFGSCSSFATCSRSVAGGGDVNGDGRDDVIVGSPADFDPSPDPPGSVYVVFGKASGDPVNVNALGAAGFRIRGIGAQDGTGRSVANAGDVNGDGLDDVALGAPGRLSAFVVFGKGSTTEVQLVSLGAGGFRMTDAESFDGAGNAVAGLGDMNGDGLAEVAVGAHLASLDDRGAVFVVFGKADATPVDLLALGTAGYRIDGPDAGITPQTGWALADAGDMNDDGRGDLVIGAPGADHNVGGSGSAYVVFGQAATATVDLDSFTNGFRIDGKDVLHGAGSSVAGGEDVNGDGIPDVIVGEPHGEFEGRSPSSGSAYVVFGKTSQSPVRLGGLNPGQVEIGGAQGEDFTGTSVDSARLDADGLADVVIGAPGVSATPGVDTGAAFVVLTRLLPRTLTLAPATATNAIGDEHCVTAHVEDAGATPAAGFDVRLDVVGVNAASATRETDSNGDAVLCYEGSLAAGTDEIIVYADGNGNGFRDFGEPGGVAIKTWVLPASERDCTVRFSGHVTTGAGVQAHFTGHAETSVAATSGRHSYVDRDRPRLRVRSRDVSALVCAEDGRSASLFGTAKLNGGQGGYRIDLERGRGARGGSYRIRLDTGYDSGTQPLEGGSIRIQGP